MKLVIAIVHDDDSQLIIRQLTKYGFGVTKLCSSGGFLRAGNTTLLIGVRKSKVDSVIEIIKHNSKSRKYSYDYTMPSYPSEGMGSSFTLGMSSLSNNTRANDFINYPDEVIMSGAVIFVLNTINFNKILYMS